MVRKKDAAQSQSAEVEVKIPSQSAADIPVLSLDAVPAPPMPDASVPSTSGEEIVPPFAGDPASVSVAPNGGKSFAELLYEDDATGGVDAVASPSMPSASVEELPVLDMAFMPKPDAAVVMDTPCESPSVVSPQPAPAGSLRDAIAQRGGAFGSRVGIKQLIAERGGAQREVSGLGVKAAIASRSYQGGGVGASRAIRDRMQGSIRAEAGVCTTKVVG